MSVEPFTIPYSQSAVDDLRSRLARTRWPDQAASSGWECVGTSGIAGG